MLDEKKLNQLKKEIKPVITLLKNAVDTVVEENVSKYPILVLHKSIINVGINLFNQSEKVPWTINLSTLEEFSVKKIISMEKVNDFRAIYKNPQEQFCLFVLNDDGSNFIFVPR